MIVHQWPKILVTRTKTFGPHASHTLRRRNLWVGDPSSRSSDLIELAAQALDHAIPIAERWLPE
jgi:hypothetical protein